MLPDAMMRRFAVVAAGLLLCVLAAPAVHGDATPADRSLVLHYVFDQNPGEVARDLSSYKNDGKIVKASFLEEVNGQRGVLRFDAGDAVLNCPDSDSLGFNGLNRDTICFILQAPLLIAGGGGRRIIRIMIRDSHLL
jgi:hypothetical protein